MEKNKRSQRWIIALCIAALALAGVGTTIALLKTSSQDVVNDFTSAKINIQIVEKDGSDKEYKSDDDVTSKFGDIKQNEVKTKIVAIENKHSDAYPTTDTFVRVRLVPVLRDKDGNNIAKQVKFELGGLNTEVWTTSTEVRNGKEEIYYYYNQILKRGEVTAPLFESVKVISAIPEGAYFELQVLADAIQARPYADGSTVQIKDTPVYQAWGWHYDVTSKKLVP